MKPEAAGSGNKKLKHVPWMQSTAPHYAGEGDSEIINELWKLQFNG
ncbi:MAG: hypothetical protein ACLRL6_20410 [Clostridium sp.]